MCNGLHVCTIRVKELLMLGAIFDFMYTIINGIHVSRLHTLMYVTIHVSNINVCI